MVYILLDHLSQMFHILLDQWSPMVHILLDQWSPMVYILLDHSSQMCEIEPWMLLIDLNDWLIAEILVVLEPATPVLPTTNKGTT